MSNAHAEQWKKSQKNIKTFKTLWNRMTNQNTF